jgi:hypothetical protein
MGDYRSAANARRSSGSRWRAVARSCRHHEYAAALAAALARADADAIMEPVVTKAAAPASINWRSAGSIPKARPAVRRGPAVRSHVTTFVKQALDRGAELFNWDARKARGKRQGSGSAASASRSAARPGRSVPTA